MLLIGLVYTIISTFKMTDRWKQDLLYVSIIVEHFQLDAIHLIETLKRYLFCFEKLPTTQ